jgi:hypothetical protein
LAAKGQVDPATFRAGIGESALSGEAVMQKPQQMMPGTVYAPISRSKRFDHPHLQMPSACIEIIETVPTQGPPTLRAADHLLTSGLLAKTKTKRWRALPTVFLSGQSRHPRRDNFPTLSASSGHFFFGSQNMPER